MIKLIIVDDHKIFRESLHYFLSNTKGIDVIGEASNGRQLLELLDSHEPNIVLMDIDMPIMDGIEATAKAIAKSPGLKVIALSMQGDNTNYHGMIKAGAKGFVLKESGSEELEKAIEKVMNDDEYYSPQLMRNIIVDLGKKFEKKDGPETKGNFSLTDREHEVLQQICNGVPNKEIASVLKISPRTVEGHRSRIMEKLRAQNTAQLIVRAIKSNLIKLG